MKGKRTKDRVEIADIPEPWLEWFKVSEINPNGLGPGAWDQYIYGGLWIVGFNEKIKIYTH